MALGTVRTPRQSRILTLAQQSKPLVRNVPLCPDLVWSRLQEVCELLLDVPFASTFSVSVMGGKGVRVRTTHQGLNPSACKTFEISSTSKFVKRYNLTSFLRLDGVQTFFGRPISFLRFCGTLISCTSGVRFWFVEVVGDVVLLESCVSAKLKMEDLAVDGLELSGLMSADISSRLKWGSNSTGGTNATVRIARGRVVGVGNRLSQGGVFDG